MTYKTRTYIAGDWTNDSDAVDILYKWNNSDYWGLDFVDAHQFHQSKDSSENCSIKKSLATRMESCKTFVLIVGSKTNTTTAGACSNCIFYSNHLKRCLVGHSTSDKSYIQFECDKAKRDNLKIVVLYNSIYKHLNNCPESVRDIGTHVAMKNSDGSWNYNSIRNAIMY